MKTMTLLVGILIGMSVIVMILYVAFGQITVRKLRRNPKTKHALGIEFVSGWDIINVAQALALPEFITKKLKRSSLSSLYADAELLQCNTSRFDRLLAGFFYWLLMLTGLSFPLLGLFDSLGLLE
jgi:hypothetical protein